MSTHRISMGTDGEVERLDDVLDNLLRTNAPSCDERSRLRIRLGVHELLVNILRHAYGARPAIVDVELAVSPARVHICVRDCGRPFTGALDPDLPLTPATEGYGLPIISRVFDQISYERADGHNHWTLTLEGAQGR